MNLYQAIKIAENVHWVGAIDDTLRDFHGYATTRGTTYNAFLITGDKNILIDTVKKPFLSEMLSRISSVIDPADIDFIISNHAEMDHSGCLPEMIALAKPERVFASVAGVKALSQHFHQDLGIEAITNAQTLTLGSARLSFVETKMLHWPDSMFTFYENAGILFSQDAFGMHLATRDLFSSHNDRSVMRYESAKYYANILWPYSTFVKKLFASLPSLNWDIQLIAPDHGPLWHTKEEIAWVMQLWQQFANGEKQRKAVVLYDTMWGSTAKMASVIADALSARGMEAVLLKLGTAHRSDVATELLDAQALLVGTPTLNKQMFPTVADTLCYLEGLKPTGIVGQTFGSYGWSPDGLKRASARLTEMGITLAGDPVGIQYVPTDESLQACHVLADQISAACSEGTQA